MKIIKLVILCSLVCLLLNACDDNSTEGDTEYYPLLEVEAASEYDLGFAVGERFADNIHFSLDLNADLLSNIGDIIAIDSVYFYEHLLSTAQAEQPEQIAELQGMCDASGAEFRSIFIFNIFGEILALYYGMQTRDIDIPEDLPLGCSDVLYKYENNIFLAHNEDGFAGLKDNMFIVKAKLPGKPEFISFSYPCLVLGVGPTINDAGIVITNNFIQGTAGDADGVPGYMVNRQLIEFTNIQEITEFIATKRIANYLNCNIVSMEENRIVSLEMASDQYSLHEVSGLYAHTNHLVHPDMLSFPVEMDASTVERYQTLQQLFSEYETHLQDVNLESMHSFLNAVAVESNPNGGLITGATLSSSIFDFENMVWRLYFSDPKDDLYQEIEF